MGTENIVETGDVIEEAASAVAENMTGSAIGSGAKIAVGFGAGIIAGVIICKFVLPKIRHKRYFQPKAVEVIRDDEEPNKPEPEESDAVSEVEDEGSEE